MTRSPKITSAALGALLLTAAAQAAPAGRTQAQSNGPNMPPSNEVVPSDIRPQDPPATGTTKEPGTSGRKSRWHDFKGPPARPPGL
jgi:hypothetical protein